jgi:CheY-like chemotaxis protein
MVDDSAEDVMLVERALEKAAVSDFFQWVRDGEEALRYLKGEGAYCDRRMFPFPTLLLLDLKMPVMNGFELLEWLKDHPDCSVIPTVVFSSSAEPEDVRKAYELGTNAYLVKPHGLQELTRKMQLLYEFWAGCERPPVPVAARC